MRSLIIILLMMLLTQISPVSYASETKLIYFSKSTGVPVCEVPQKNCTPKFKLHWVDDISQDTSKISDGIKWIYFQRGNQKGWVNSNDLICIDVFKKYKKDNWPIAFLYSEVGDFVVTFKFSHNGEYLAKDLSSGAEYKGSVFISNNIGMFKYPNPSNDKILMSFGVDFEKVKIYPFGFVEDGIYLRRFNDSRAVIVSGKCLYNCKE